ncbi:MAG: winged helix-turn-helix domain-containing protein [Thermoguttaceae bacterium]|jgi:two-component system phosphate regulon response regulator PhoB
MVEVVVSLANQREILISGDSVFLTRTEASILRFLVSNPGQAFTRRQILDGIHRGLYAISDRSIDVQVLNLRRKLGLTGRAIETVRRVGYRFVASPPADTAIPNKPSDDDAGH